jgi:hypothetical protein
MRTKTFLPFFLSIALMACASPPDDTAESGGESAYTETDPGSAATALPGLWVANDWDVSLPQSIELFVGGTYAATLPCPPCDSTPSKHGSWSVDGTTLHLEEVAAPQSIPFSLTNDLLHGERLTLTGAHAKVAYARKAPGRSPPQ